MGRRHRRPTQGRARSRRSGEPVLLNGPVPGLFELRHRRLDLPRTWLLCQLLQHLLPIEFCRRHLYAEFPELGIEGALPGYNTFLLDSRPGLHWPDPSLPFVPFLRVLGDPLFPQRRRFRRPLLGCVLGSQLQPVQRPEVEADAGLLGGLASGRGRAQLGVDLPQHDVLVLAFPGRERGASALRLGAVEPGRLFGGHQLLPIQCLQLLVLLAIETLVCIDASLVVLPCVHAHHPQEVVILRLVFRVIGELLLQHPVAGFARHRHVHDRSVLGDRFALVGGRQELLGAEAW
mmetsp:Transcript_15562/g.43404  ORF Transcript_15562/g.43404 Transcript_15562/m.43404 type:complete len:290 (-) Transcript_15562:1225-2094(-)